MRWWKAFAIALVLLVILMAVAVWWAIPRPAIVTSARGDTFTLEGYQLSTNTVRYRFPKSMFDDPKLRWVPNMIPDAATNVTLVFATPKARRVEFLAKPVQG